MFIRYYGKYLDENKNKIIRNMNIREEILYNNEINIIILEGSEDKLEYLSFDIYLVKKYVDIYNHNINTFQIYLI